MIHYQRFLLITLTTLITTSLQSGVTLPGILPAQQVWAQTPDTRNAEAHKLYVEAILQVQINQTQAAIKSFQQALIIFRDIKDRKSEGVVLSDLGLAYYILKDYPKAINYYKQSLVIEREVKDSKLEALVQQWLVDAKLASNPQKAEADRLLQQVIEQAKTGQFTAALQSWQQALQIYREIKDRKGEGISLGNLGLAYLSLGDYPKAIDYYQQSLAIAREIKDRQGEGISLRNLGNAYHSLGDYPKAIDYIQQSLAIAREIKDRNGEGA